MYAQPYRSPAIAPPPPEAPPVAAPWGPAAFDRSRALQARLHAAIPGGCHTYAKGDDQFPEFMAPVLERGRGCRVWDVDGNEYVEYGMGLRAVTLGHAYEPVVAAVRRALRLGCNLGRPSTMELAAAEEFLNFTQAGEMVKFAKNGSDVTTAAVKLARAATGRDLVALCADHPFFSTDDWFMGTTPLRAGIPAAVQALTRTFRYNDLPGVAQLLDEHPGQVACLLLEVERDQPPAPGFLEGLRRLCDQHGTLLIFDEIITGFRWHPQGAQALYGVQPDLSTFAKALGNGFAIAALAGRREWMRLGGLDHSDRDRVFLLSTTNGAEMSGLAAARAVLRTYASVPVVAHLHQQGERLREGLEAAARDQGVAEHFRVLGPGCCLYYGTRNAEGLPSQGFRTLFLQETLRRGLLLPSFVISYAHTPAVVDHTVARVHEALGVYRRALEDGLENHLMGRWVQPVYRARN